MLKAERRRRLDVSFPHIHSIRIIYPKLMTGSQLFHPNDAFPCADHPNASDSGEQGNQIA